MKTNQPTTLKRFGQDRRPFSAGEGDKDPKGTKGQSTTKHEPMTALKTTPMNIKSQTGWGLTRGGKRGKPDLFRDKPDAARLSLKEHYETQKEKALHGKCIRVTQKPLPKGKKHNGQSETHRGVPVRQAKKEANVRM